MAKDQNSDLTTIMYSVNVSAKAQLMEGNGLKVEQT